VKILCFQVDGKFPNLALMKLARWHRERGDQVFLTALLRDLKGLAFDKVYSSSIFAKSSEKRRAEFALLHPNAIVGGDGYKPVWSDLTQIGRNIGSNLREVITDCEPDLIKPDYSDYPLYLFSLGYSQRGCRLDCSFCRMKTREGEARGVSTFHDLWRGEGFPKCICLLDNDFFGQSQWRERLDEAVTGKFKVCFNQGINIRLINEEQAQVLSKVKYYDDQFKKRRLYTAWDNLGDEKVFKTGIKTITSGGIPARHLMVYMLIGYDHRKKAADTRPVEEQEPEILYRYNELKALGCMPYPMVFDRTNRRLCDFQRWVLGRYYTVVPWEKYDPHYRKVT
jgi:hypothetical protein